MTRDPLTPAQVEILDAAVEEVVLVATLTGPADVVEPALIGLLRAGYVELHDDGAPVDPAEAELALRGPRTARSPALRVVVTEAGIRARRIEGVAAAREFADLEREARHLRGF